MKRFLIAEFSSAAAAASTGDRLRDLPAARVRVHRDEIDLLLGSDLAGTGVQDRAEFDVLNVFGLTFVGFVAVGALLDLWEVLGFTGFSMTMAFGWIGVLVATLAVVRRADSSLDGALARTERALERGATVLTLAVEQQSSDAAERTVRDCGGHTFYVS
ncbi:MAG: hypothetical protein KDB80_01455 [Planctomycetes bacterium]|nr:hypothetical protein [Planctomycetota bacterium]